MFTTLSLENFRGFENLCLEGLQRVNLIVGRNNAGKTSLLEGIALLADPGQLQQMGGLLRTQASPPHSPGMSAPAAMRYFRWLLRDSDVWQDTVLVMRVPHRQVVLRRPGSSNQIAPEYCVEVFNSHSRQALSSGFSLGEAGGLVVYALKGQPVLRCSVVSVQHLLPNELVLRFAQAVRQKGGEERIEGLLRQVDGRIRKVRVAPASDGNQLMVDLGLSEMLPISQVGQGIYRLVAIFSELIGDNPQMCIIDEIENGIHHSMLEQVWTGIATAAEQLDIQVFATTHSQECIEAAHAAFAKRPEYDFGIVQLFRMENGPQGRVLDRRLIEAAITGEIDLR